jgi:spermidine/putrescine transport system substrate-binding protein
MTQVRPIRPRGGAILTRRALLGRMGALAGAGIVGPTVLAACGGDDDGGGSGGDSKALWFENWPAYIDEETVDLFKDESGLDFRYTEAFNDNNEYFAKVQSDLAAGRSIGPDIIAPTYWMAARLIGLEWVQEIPFDDIPNTSNLLPELQNPAWDPDGKFSLPWQSGMTGIAYNIAETGRELGSMEDLFDPEFKGKIGMLTEMRDTLGLVMLGLGYDPQVVDEEGAMAALDRIEHANGEGQFRAFTGNEYLRSLENGDFAACVAWSGDIIQLQYDRPDIQFVIPDEGGMSWYDTMVIPKGAANGYAAADWINFVYDPVQAAQLTYWVQYVPTVKGVREELIKMGGDAAELADSPILFPSEEVSARLNVFAAIDDDLDNRLTERFLRIIGG